jgi:hypothetical protein
MDKPNKRVEPPAIADDPIWLEARRWIDAQRGSQNQSRFIFRSDTPAALMAKLLGLRKPCAFCGNLMSPVRKAMTFTVAALHVTGMRDDGHKQCSHREEARAQVRWLNQDLEKVDKPPRISGGGSGDVDQRSLWQ